MFIYHFIHLVTIQLYMYMYVVVLEYCIAILHNVPGVTSIELTSVEIFIFWFVWNEIIVQFEILKGAVFFLNTL